LILDVINNKDTTYKQDRMPRRNL